MPAWAELQSALRQSWPLRAVRLVLKSHLLFHFPRLLPARCSQHKTQVHTIILSKKQLHARVGELLPRAAPIRQQDTALFYHKPFRFPCVTETSDHRPLTIRVRHPRPCTGTQSSLWPL